MAERYPETPLPLPMDPIETLIHEKFDQLIVCLNRRREQLIAQHREKHAASADLEQTLQQLRDTKTDLQARMKDNVLHSMREKILAEIDTKMRQLADVATEVEVAFECNTRQLEYAISALGQLVERGAIPIPNYPALLQPRISVWEQGKDRQQYNWPKGIAFSEQSNIIYVANENSSSPNRNVNLFSAEGEYMDTFGMGHVQCAVGIAVSGDDAYVSDAKLDCIFHFWLHLFQFIAKVGKHGPGKGEFSSPQQLTVAPNRSVFVADCNNHRVAVLTHSLEFQRSFSHASMTQPCDVKILNNKVFVLSSVDNPCLHVFSQSGEKLRSLITCGTEGNKQIKAGNSFCFDRQQNILISDFGDNCIKVFSREGALRHTLGDTQDREKRIQPQGIVVTNSNKVICASAFTDFGLHIFY